MTDYNKTADSPDLDFVGEPQAEPQQTLQEAQPPSVKNGVPLEAIPLEAEEAATPPPRPNYSSRPPAVPPRPPKTQVPPSTQSLAQVSVPPTIPPRPKPQPQVPPSPVPKARNAAMPSQPRPPVVVPQTTPPAPQKPPMPALETSDPEDLVLVPRKLLTLLGKQRRELRDALVECGDGICKLVKQGGM